MLAMEVHVLRIGSEFNDGEAMNTSSMDLDMLTSARRRVSHAPHSVLDIAGERPTMHIPRSLRFLRWRYRSHHVQPISSETIAKGGNVTHNTRNQSRWIAGGLTFVFMFNSQEPFWLGRSP